MSRTALTNRKVETLKPASKGKRYQVMDAVAPGLGVRVTDCGQRTFIRKAQAREITSPLEQGGCNDMTTTMAVAGCLPTMPWQDDG